MLLLLFRCLFIQLLILHTLSSTFFLCILTCCYYFLVTKMTRFSLSHTHTHTLTFARRESLSTSHRRCRQCIFFCIVVVLSLSLPMSILTCSFRTREKCVDKLFTPSMHVCVPVLPFANTHFSFLYIINFPFL
jgi:hypothetical protein